MVVEVDINNVDPTEMAQTVQTAGMYTNGDTLWQHVSKSTADKAKAFFAKYDVPETVSGMFKPWLAGTMASVLPMMKAGMQADLGIDKHFLDLAKAKGKKIEQAETADFQLKLLESLPDNVADAFLSYSIGAVSHSKDDDLKMARAWRDGDIAALEASLNDHPKELDGYMNAIIRDRNPHMADVAEKHLKGGEGPCFFVVGAGHLIGDDGVVALLKKRGYQVWQVANQ